MNYKVDGKRHYDETANLWQMYNENYHDMVGIMMQIIKSSSMLRIEAPEWYPIQEKTQGQASSHKGIGSCEKVRPKQDRNNEDELKKWVTPSKCAKGTDIKCDIQEIKNDNYYEILSDYRQTSDDEEKESEINVEMQTDVDDEMSDEYTLMMCHEELKHCKGESQARNEIIQSMENEKKQIMKEVEGHKKRVSCLEELNVKQEESFTVILDRLLLSNDILSLTNYAQNNENKFSKEELMIKEKEMKSAKEDVDEYSRKLRQQNKEEKWSKDDGDVIDGDEVKDTCNLCDSINSCTSDFGSENHEDIEMLREEMRIKFIESNNKIMDF